VRREEVKGGNCGSRFPSNQTRGEYPTEPEGTGPVKCQGVFPSRLKERKKERWDRAAGTLVREKVCGGQTREPTVSPESTVRTVSVEKREGGEKSTHRGEAITGTTVSGLGLSNEKQTNRHQALYWAGKRRNLEGVTPKKEALERVTRTGKTQSRRRGHTRLLPKTKGGWCKPVVRKE